MGAFDSLDCFGFPPEQSLESGEDLPNILRSFGLFVIGVRSVCLQCIAVLRAEPSLLSMQVPVVRSECCTDASCFLCFWGKGVLKVTQRALRAGTGAAFGPRWWASSLH